MKRKIYNFLLSLVIALNVVTPIKLSAEEITEKVFLYDDYTVEYSVKNSWIDSQNINITITNIGEKPINGWALGIDAGGEINSLWNGSVYKCTNSEYIIKNLDYNYEIKPNTSITFGYTLTGKQLSIPTKIEMFSKRVESTGGYKVELIETNNWDTGFQGEITICNLTSKPIDAWNLSFDADFTIDDIWNANIISENNGVYEISCSQSTMSIMPDSTVVIGIRGSKNADLRTSFKTVKLTETIIDESTETIPEYPIDENNEGVFCKNITSEDDIEYTSNDFSFIKNQLLLMADDNITYQEMSDIVRELNAEIVGYIDISNEYQIEFNSNTNIDYLNSVMNQLLQNSSIESVSLNYYYTLQPNFMPNDEKMSTASGINNDNWNLYAINAFRAWDYYDDMSEVKIGLIDSSFDENHEDLDFKKTWKNPLKDTIKSQDELSIYLKHGTHVAGIMAAGFNNNNGITGVCPKNELYGYAITEGASSAEIKTALVKLIKKDVKVINVSLGTLSKGKLQIINMGANELFYAELNEEANKWGASIEKWLKRYDFTIVVSAGNDSIEAEYSNYLNNIDNTSVNNHIIVVGAIGQNSNLDYYSFSKSSYGNRVDVVAPGVKILSTVPYNKYEMTTLNTIDNSMEDWTGTSMAAPHVSGIAGMMYSVNPELSGDQVKAIITGTSKLRTVEDNHGYEYGIADAKLAVSTAYYYDKSEKIVFGKLEDANDPSKKYNNIKITVSYMYSGSKQVITIQSDENGEYELILPKQIDLSSLDIKIDGYEIVDTKCLGVFFGSSVMLKTKIIPAKSTISGIVYEFNKTTKITKPLSGVEVAVYKESDPGSIVASTKTSSDGTYAITIKEQGEYIVKIRNEKQESISVLGGDYKVNATFEVEDKIPIEDYIPKDGITLNIPSDPNDPNNIGTRGISGTGTAYDLTGTGIYLSGEDANGKYYVHIYFDGYEEIGRGTAPYTETRKGRAHADLIDSSGQIIDSATYWFNDGWGYYELNKDQYDGYIESITIEANVTRNVVSAKMQMYKYYNDGRVSFRGYNDHSIYFISTIATYMDNATSISNTQPSFY